MSWRVVIDGVQLSGPDGQTFPSYLVINVNPLSEAVSLAEGC